MSKEEKALAKAEKQRVKIEAEAKAKIEAEERAKAKAEAKAQAEEEAQTKVEEEAKALGVKKTRVVMAGFKEKSNSDKMDKEKARHKKLVKKRMVRRIEKAKEKAKMKPIDKRKALLASRLKAHRARQRARTYSDKTIQAWLEEYQLIVNSPKMWNQLTKNGKDNYVPGNKKERTMRDVLDSMNLDD